MKHKTLDISDADIAQENGIDVIIEYSIKLQLTYNILNFEGTGKKWA